MDTKYKYNYKEEEFLLNKENLGVDDPISINMKKKHILIIMKHNINC